MIIFRKIKARVSREGKVHERRLDLILGGLYCVCPLRLDALHIGRPCRMHYADGHLNGILVTWLDTGEAGVAEAMDLVLVLPPTEAETDQELANNGPDIRPQLEALRKPKAGA